jgi:hypothetical protein
MLMMVMLSPVGDSAAESYVEDARVMLVMTLLSHAGDDANGVTWPWRDVAAESC